MKEMIYKKQQDYKVLNNFEYKGYRGEIVIIDYSSLWKTMKDKNISQYKLLQNGIDNKTLDSLKKGNNITLITLEKICNILECTPNDVVSFK